MEEKNKKEKTDYFILAVLLLIIAAFGFSFYKYFVKLDYDILLSIECDPKISICVTDEESYYKKFLAGAKVLDENCPDAEDEQCIINLESRGLAKKLDCEEYLEEGESCTNPEEFVAGEGPDESTSTSENTKAGQ